MQIWNKTTAKDLQKTLAGILNMTQEPYFMKPEQDKADLKELIDVSSPIII